MDIQEIKGKSRGKYSQDYIRVGTEYFKIINKPDRFGIVRTELKKWNKETLLFDHDKKYMYTIQQFDDFVIDPNNNGNSRVIANNYNMYNDFPHTPSAGKWPWTLVLLKQVFGSQFKSGMTYLKVMYSYPKKALPILVLVSSERATGKSTFLDWLNMIFGANMVMIEPDVIGSPFNGEFATSNIIAIDETILDKQIAVEKIKSLATKKFISVNIKQVAQFKLPFFGKIIMASNNEDKFMKIDDKEIRFWIRRLGTPKVVNHNILNDMISEIPAFVDYLKTMNDPDFSLSRMVLTPDQIKNEYLEAAKKESRSGLYKELIELFTHYFLNSEQKECLCTPGDIKDKFFCNNNNIDRNYIRRVIKLEFEREPSEKVLYYSPFNGVDFQRGRPFKFESNDFFNSENLIQKANEIPF